MKIKINVCEMCKSEDCSGVIYQTEDMWGSYGLHVGKIKICESNEDLVTINCKLKYKLISGHGDYRYYNVEKL